MCYIIQKNKIKIKLQENLPKLRSVKSGVETDPNTLYVPYNCKNPPAVDWSWFGDTRDIVDRENSSLRWQIM